MAFPDDIPNWQSSIITGLVTGSVAVIGVLVTIFLSRRRERHEYSRAFTDYQVSRHIKRAEHLSNIIAGLVEYRAECADIALRMEISKAQVKSLQGLLSAGAPAQDVLGMLNSPNTVADEIRLRQFASRSMLTKLVAESELYGRIPDSDLKDDRLSSHIQLLCYGMLSRLIVDEIGDDVRKGLLAHLAAMIGQLRELIAAEEDACTDLFLHSRKRRPKLALEFLVIFENEKVKA